MRSSCDRRKYSTLGSCLLAAVLLGGCGGGHDGSSPSTHTLGGTVTGLAGVGLTLSSGSGLGAAVTGSGTFTFATPVASGTAFNVTVATQPSTPTQTCVVAHGSGSIDSTDVTNVAITCTTNTYTIGGTVTGLGGSSGLVLTNGSDTRAITGDGAFTFATAVDSGNTYSVTVSTQPTNPGETCTASNSAGTVGGGNVTNVSVACTINSFPVGGGVAGLTGSGLVLTLNGGSPLTVSGNGQFAFPNAIQTTAAYTVAIQIQPTNPAQTCTVSNGSGTVPNVPVIAVAVICGNPVARFAYVTNALNPPAGSPPDTPTPDGTLGAFAIDSSTGALSPAGAPISSGLLPVQIELDPLRRFAYVVNFSPIPGPPNSGLSSFLIDPSSGAPTAASANPVSFPEFGPVLVAGPSGKFAYVSTGASGNQIGLSQYSVDQTTGTLSLVVANVFGPNLAPSPLAIDPTGKFAYATTNRAGTSSGVGVVIVPLTVDATTGALAMGTAPVSLVDGYRVTIDPTGRFLYASTHNSAEIYGFSIDATTGGLTPIAGSPFTVGAAANTSTMTVDPRGAFLYLSGYATATVATMAIDSATGALGSAAVTTVGPNFVNGLGAPPMVFDPSGKFVYLAVGQTSLLGFSVDMSTGALTPFAGAFNVGTNPSAVALLR